MSAGWAAMTNRKEKNRMHDGKMNTAPLTSKIADEQILDVTGEVCPMTFVRTRLALDRLPTGRSLRVRLRGTEPRRSVPENAAVLGYEVVDVTDAADGTSEVVLRKARRAE